MWLHTMVMALVSAGGSFAAPAGGGSLDDIALGEEERISVLAGRVVAKVVPTTDRTEVASVVAMRAPMNLDHLLEYARAPVGVRRREDSLGAGRLANPPALSDFAALRLDERDLESLANCRVGACRVRLPADAIVRLGTGVERASHLRKADQEEAFRGILVNEAAAYLAGGHAALPPYADGPNAVHRAAGLSELMRRPLFLHEGAPDVEEYLRSFSSERPRLIDEFLSWRQEKFWRKPLVGLYHTSIWEASQGDERRILMVSKQFYASHFYESAIEVLEIRKKASEHEADLAFVSRVRADIRPSGFNWLERALLRRLIKGRLEDQFGGLKERFAQADETRRRAGESSLEERRARR